MEARHRRRGRRRGCRCGKVLRSARVAATRAHPMPPFVPPLCGYQKRRVPKTRAEKEAFKAVLRAMGEATGPLPANFSDALEAAQLAWVMEEVRAWESLLFRHLAASRTRPSSPEACFGNA